MSKDYYEILGVGLFALFCQDAQKDDGDSQECSKNIEIGHYLSKINHNYSLAKNKLVSQKIKASAMPAMMTNASHVLAAIGPTNKDAKKIRPTSRDISASIMGFANASI